MATRIMIYGANGYTGKRFAQFLIDQNIQPVLAGRSEKVKSVAQILKCEYRIFKVEAAAEQLNDVDVLINLAGPFAITQTALISACLQTKTHYLDIAGEYEELKSAYQFDEQAQRAGILLLPGAGFGVVPTDIAAKLAAQRLGQPPHKLVLAYATQGSASRGTLKTVLKDINKQGVVIKNGVAETAQPAMQKKNFSVNGKSFKAVYNPWRADLFTAQLSTQAKNIETYTVFPGFVVSMMKGRLLWLRNLLLKRIINWLPEGPNEKQLKKGKTFIEATAFDENGNSKKVSMQGPEAYWFTFECLYAIVKRLENGLDQAGMLSPSALGLDLLDAIKTVKISWQIQNGN